MRTLALAALVSVAAAGRWSIVNKDFFGAQDVFGLSFWNATYGLIAGQDVIGEASWVSKDGGVTWNTSQFTIISLSDAAVTATAGVVCGDLGAEYTTDFGATWNGTTDLGAAAGCVTIRRLGYGQGFGAVGPLGDNEVFGAAVSVDNGVSFQFFDASAAALYPPIYGAFPAAAAWYLSCEGQDQNTGTNYGQIVKSADGGSNWTVVYTPPANTRTLGIDCADADNCCTAISDGNNDAILCSHDGGATWVEGWNVSTTGGETFINDVRADQQGNWWAVGGEFASSLGWVLYSGNKGASWAIDTTFTGAYGAGLDVAVDGSLFGIVFEAGSDDAADVYIISAQANNSRTAAA